MKLFNFLPLVALGMGSAFAQVYQPITQDLIKLVNASNWQPLFQQAINTARASGIQEMQDIKTLTDYYNYVDFLVTWMPTENYNGTMVYNMLCKFYFVLDQDPVLYLQNLIYPPYIQPNQTQTNLSAWMSRFAKSFGSFLSTTQSINAQTIKTFYDSPKYNMSQYPVPPNGWNTFNQFFAREINMSLRPIDGPNNPYIITSGADSEWHGSWSINGDNRVSLKHLQWDIEELLANSAYKDDFENGWFTHAFLGPADYHREHAPVSGTVLEAKNIAGNVYLEVDVANGPNGQQNLKIRRRRPGDKQKKHKPKPTKTKKPKHPKPTECPKPCDPKPPVSKKPGFVGGPDDGETPLFWAPDYPGYQFAQARGLIVIDNPTIGKVAVLPIGMAQVSSVVLSVKPGQYVNKGDEISQFQFGGSDIIYLFQQKSNVTITAVEGAKYNVGKQIAVANPWTGS